MAKKATWSLNDLKVDVHGKKLTIRTAAASHGVPNSTLYDYASGKIEVGTVLTAAEESKIVEYVQHMRIWPNERACFKHC